VGIIKRGRSSTERGEGKGEAKKAPKKTYTTSDKKGKGVVEKHTLTSQISNIPKVDGEKIKTFGEKRLRREGILRGKSSRYTSSLSEGLRSLPMTLPKQGKGRFLESDREKRGGGMGESTRTLKRGVQLPTRGGRALSRVNYRCSQKMEGA